MSDDKRTRAELQQAIALGDFEREQLVEQHAKDVENFKRRLDSLSPESRALDACVKALDALKQAESNRKGSDTRGYSSATFGNTYSGGYVEIRPLDAVGQVLAYLRMRFGHIDPSGEVEHLRQRVNQLLNENGQLREQLQRVGQVAGEGMPR